MTEDTVDASLQPHVRGRSVTVARPATPADRPTASTSRPALRSAVAIVLLALSTVVTVLIAQPMALVFLLAYCGAGAYLLVRRPDNSVGWFLTATGVGLVLSSVQSTASIDDLMASDLDAVQALQTWAYGWGWSAVPFGVLGIALVFPSGRLPGARGRRAAIAALAVVALLGIVIALQPTILVRPAGSALEAIVPNPLPLAPDAGFWAFVPGPALLYPAMAMVALGGIVAMVLRFRRSSGLERLQFRWLVAALVIVTIGTLIWIAAQTAQLEGSTLSDAAVLLAYPAIPIAIAVAVMRYRLYDIDRIVSRTISYAVVTGVLVSVFAGLVIGFQAALASVTQGETLAVAGSTLVAFALFQPLRRRVQAVVDRRFDRAHYDDARMTTAFAERLRNQVDLAAVAADLDATVRTAMAPTLMGVWLRSEPERPELEA